ncbi:putative alcohol dehydrogenase [Fusarium austroafricanum]|uniref:Putative alcohol dehydrogenase n=1 Tax=Fusarium austroafricanum TaxID=2364996 RepID=A0A8H4NYC3_9HYPO|nr:putative alcohol dehydrogenase [Fusarium austroafricanum]
MAPRNRASWLKEKQSPQNVVDDAPYTEPSTNELVIKTAATAINPADFMIQKLGILINEYPAILGCDVVGQVVQVHPSLADKFEIGDRVVGAAQPLRPKGDCYCYSAFQDYVVLQAPCIAKIPNDVPYKDAVVLPLAFNTAASCLFTAETLELPGPKMPMPESGINGHFIVWGASSSVGACAVQLATAAGYAVIGVGSTKNHGMIQDAGAVKAFDQANSSIVYDISEYLRGKEVVGAFLAVNSEDALKAMCKILDSVGGKKFISSVVPGSEAWATAGVKVTTNFMTGSESRLQCQDAVWPWLNEAMERGEMKYLPKPQVVGNGLGDIQKACDLLEKGVSAKKLVVLI